MTRFSANLGFLWADLPLADAIRAAARAGFAAVECHWPYDEDPAGVAAALDETGLPMLSLNTVRGEGAFGLAALPERVDEARAAIMQAVAYAAEIGTEAVHVMAGMARGDAAREVFEDNLAFACARAAARGATILIEPMNAADAPGYHLSTPAEAAEVIGAVGAKNLKMMFDCYHVARRGLDVGAEFARYQKIIGHVQFAGVPARGRPDRGTLDYAALFARMAELGWERPLGAEYRVEGASEASLGWMETLV